MRGFLIGNGFDIAHGMPTNFSDFYEFVKIHNPSNISCFEYFYDKEAPDIWGRFEDLVGKIDYEHFMAFMGSIYNVKDDYGLTYFADDIDFDHILCDYDELAKDLKSWVKQISEPKQRYCLSPDDIYVTFNYTKVLENVYNIKKSNILHIHGEIDSDDLIVGYNNINIEKVLEEADCGIYTGDFPYEAEGYELLNEFLFRFHKDTDEIISKNKVFLDKFAECDDVYIIGLSFSVTDINYINYIVKSLNKSAKVYVNYYSKTDYSRVKRFIKKNKLSNVKVGKIDKLLMPSIM